VARVQMYKTTYCVHCMRARMLLNRREIPFDEIDVAGDHERRAWLVRMTGRKTVPQIFIDGKPIGGAAELVALDRTGELARILASDAPVPTT
jgi:glutaredoxin 3